MSGRRTIPVRTEREMSADFDAHRASTVTARWRAAGQRRSPGCWPARTSGSSRGPRAGPASRCTAPIPDELHPHVREALVAAGITSLYSHQADAWESVMRRGHTIVTTGTASGKSLCFNLPVLHMLSADPRARALYLYPTKALAQDQARRLSALRHRRPAPRDLRRRHAAGGARRDPAALEPRADQPRHAARRHPAPPRALGRLPREPGAGGRGRGPCLPRACSAPTSPTCCAACGGWPPPTGPGPASC